MVQLYCDSIVTHINRSSVEKLCDENQSTVAVVRQPRVALVSDSTQYTGGSI
jgi:hypothetical protein